MHHYQQTPQNKDPRLWQLAQRRASFKTHLSTYLIISAFLWVLWYFTGGARNDGGLPWPVWPMLGWGIGLAFHYLSAYAWSDSNSVEREYEKLTNNNKPETF